MAWPEYKLAHRGVMSGTQAISACRIALIHGCSPTQLVGFMALGLALRVHTLDENKDGFGHRADRKVHTCCRTSRITTLHATGTQQSWLTWFFHHGR